MNKLLCFWAPLPIPESHRLIAAYKDPLKELKSKNSPLTHAATCILTSMPSQHNLPTHLPTHAHKHTLFSSPKTIMSTSLKNICSNCFGSKTISCVLRPPHPPDSYAAQEHRGLSVHSRELFLPSLWGTDPGRGGGTQPLEAFQLQEWLPACTHAESHWHINVVMHCSTHRHTQTQQCAL